MGLLDAMNSPEMAGAMGLLSAAGPSRMPVSVGQGLASGFSAYQGMQDKLSEREIKALNLKHLKAQMDQEELIRPLQLEQLKNSIAQARMQQELGSQFPQLIEQLRGGSKPVSYQDQLPNNADVKFDGKPEEYFRMAMQIPDATEKRSALEAGFRQWPEYRPQMPSSATDRDPATTLGAYGAAMGVAGLKGGDDVIKFAQMLNPRELKGNTTYQNPLTGQERFMPGYENGQMPDGQGGVKALPGMMDFLKQKATATIDPVQRAKTIYDTGIDPATGQSVQQGSNDLPASAKNSVRQKEQEVIASKSGDMLESSKSMASAAVDSMATIHQIRGALSNAYAGPMAMKRMTLAQVGEMMGVNGADATEKVANTRAIINGLAKMSLDAAGKLKGSGSVSDAERALLAKAASGDISELTPVEIKTLLDISERQAVKAYDSHKATLKKAKDQGINVWAFEVGNMPSTPLPKGAKASDLVKGRIYATDKGDLRWNGMQFEEVQ